MELNTKKTTLMRKLLRTFTVACATSLGIAALAQNAVTVIGDVMPCNGTPYPVWIFSDPGTVPVVDTVINTTANCSYAFTFYPVTSTGGIAVKTSCDGGLTWGVEDSVAYDLGSGNLDSLLVNLSCGGTTSCAASFTVQQAMGGGALIPWQISTTNLSTGNGPLSYSWWMPDGSISTTFEPGYTFTQAGAYGICLTITNADSSCTAWHCDTIAIGSNGFLYSGPIWYDCLGVLWGPNGPGTACTTFLGQPGTWTADCQCLADTSNTGCQACFTTAQSAPFTAIFSSCSTGGNPPFTYIWDFSDGGAEPGNPITHVYPGPGTYGVCLNAYDANGNWCQTCDSVVVAADGTINPVNSLPCDAGFWAIQAYDSTAGGVEPIPNEVWVWNLSSGGNGSYQFLWDFGDGTSSTEAFPTHDYSGPGPWLLCLTMTSGDPATGGCTDTYCDSLGMDANGILVGMVVEGHGANVNTRDGGFTLNVIQGTPSGIAEQPAFTDLRVWPNPVGDLLNIALHSNQRGAVPVTVIDPTGHTVLGGTFILGGGEDVLRLPVEKLSQGLYMVRIGDGAHGITKRFLKVQP